MIDIDGFLVTAIYLISSSLSYPTRALLLALFLWVVLLSGAFFAEWVERSRLDKCPPDELPDVILQGITDRVLPHRVRDYIQRLSGLLESGRPTEAQIENLIQATTLQMWKSLDSLRLLIRLGPSLGLMGTLIPMGTGLAALGQGDLTRLSSDLVIAFTTTVVGLAIGVTAFALHTIKHRWIEEDLKNLELATELLAGEQGEKRT